MTAPQLLNDDPLSTTAIFGGTFDPPHQGHVAVIRQILAMDRFERIVLAITAQNPLKERRATGWDLRRKMLEMVLASESIPLTSNPLGKGVHIADLAYRFTHEFVDHWKSQVTPHITWVIGEDLRNEVSTWRDWDRLALPLLIVPEIEGFRSTQVRAGALSPHPAIRKIIQEKNLYSGD